MIFTHIILNVDNIFLYFYKDHISFQFWPADAAFCDELHDLEVHCKECSWSGKLQNFEVCLMNQLTPKIFQKKNKEKLVSYWGL